MILSPALDRGPSLMMIEGCLTAIAIALAFAMPRLGCHTFSHVERAFKALARRKTLSIAIVGIIAFLLRLYNRADINSSKIIWARDMGPAENLDLIRCYKDHTVWFVQPDTVPSALTPYPGAGK